MTGYDTVLEIVAENPGLETGELREIVSEQGGDPEAAVELLERAADSGDVVEADERFWVMRKGEYAFSEYDHEITDAN